MDNVFTGECLLCGSRSVLIERGIDGYLEQQKFDIWHCNTCSSSFSIPRIDDPVEIYNLIYKNIRGIPNYYRYLHYANTVLNELNPLDYLCSHEQSFYGIREALNKIIKARPGIKILEIGCGLGYLTFSLNKAGFEATGIDISEDAVRQANEKFGNNYFCRSVEELAADGGGNYDVVIMTELIEHLNDINSFIGNAAKLIKKDGCLIITTPDNGAFIKKHAWYTDLPPVHSWWLSKKSLTVIGEKLGMKVRFVHFRKFYRNKPVIINMNDLRPEKPTFNSLGELVAVENPVSSINGGGRKVSIVRNFTGDGFYFFLKRTYYRLRPGYLVFGKNGFSICAVLYN